MPSWLLLWPERARTVPSPRTIAPQLRQRAPPNVPFLLLLRVPGRSGAAPSRSAAVLLAVPSRCNGDTNVVSMATCAPCHRVKPSATTSSLRPSSTLTSAKSKSRTKVLVLTLAPASLHLCRSLLQREPSPAQDPCHTARCSMMAKRRRKRSKRKGWASILVILLMGTAVKVADATGPL